MKKGMTLLKKFLPLIIILIFVIPLILVGVNYTKYDCIILSKEPDGIFSSAYTNKLAVITDGQLRIYDENGKYRDIKTAFRVTYAYPLEDTAWLIDDNDNLYELNYKYTTETTVSEVVLQNIKSFFGTPRQFAAIDNNGDLYVWGDNGQSLLGIDGEEYIEKPMKADYIKNVKKVAFGNLVTLLLTENGDVYEAGVYKFQDEVSADKPIYITSFTKIEVLSDITDICMGEDVFAVCNDKVVEWGYGYVGLDNNMASFCHKEGLKISQLVLIVVLV